MAATVIYKPDTSKGPVVLVPDNGTKTSPTITGPDGKVYTGKYLNTNEGRHQFVFPPDVIGIQGGKLSYGGQDTTLGDGRQSYEGSDLSNLQPRAKGSVGSGGGSYPAGFAPGTSPGGYGSYPAFQQYPSPTMMEAAKLMFTDPAEFAKKYSPLINSQFVKNYDTANNLALKQLNTELTGLEAFAPAASALKRKETSVDNIFNQYQRTQQINSVAPGLSGAIQGQLGQAQSYMQGRAPDAVTDAGLELGYRSAAADQSTQGGFGASSSVAKKSSDLRSADERVKLSQYGNQLLGQNVQNQNTLLAPTEYSNAGGQINVTPSISGSQLGQNNLNQLNQYSLLPISAALNTTVQQNTTQAQFQQQANQVNAATENQFKIGQFDYNTGYANSLAAANQSDINTNFQLAQQKRAEDILKKYQNSSQNSALFGQIASALVTAFGSGGNTGLLQQITGLLGIDTSGSGSQGPYGPGATHNTGIGNPNDVSNDSGIPPADTIDTNTPVEGNVLPPSDVLDYNDMASSSGSDGLSLYSSSASLRKVQQNPVGQSTDARSVQAQQTNTVHPAPQAIVNTNNIMRSVGLSKTPSKDSVNIGYDARGNPTYSSRSLSQSNDPTLGYKVGQGYSQILNDMGAFKTEADKSTFDQVISVGQDTALVASLGDAASRGDKKAFINTLLSAYKKPLINKLTDDPQNAAGLTAALSGAQLFTNWNKLSATQKGLALTNIGIKTYQFASGEDLTKSALVYNSDGTTGMTVGQGLDLIQAGYNTFAMVKNWDDMTTVQKIAGVAGNAAATAQLAQSFGLMGEGSSGAAVGIAQADLASATFNTAVPQFGVGAVYSPLGTASAPEGYSLVSQGADGTVAIPTANSASAAGAASEGSSAGAGAATQGATAEVGTLGYVAGGASVAAGAYQVYKGWGTGGSQGALNGVVGGSAMAAGLYTMGATNPYLLAGVVAVSVVGNATKAGKSQGQIIRDKVRGALKTNGIVDANYDIKLPDGSTFNIGQDGHGGQHMMSDLTQRSAADKAALRSPKLFSYDIDYSNDLDYASGLGGVTLSRLITGNKATAIDQMGGQIGNAGISNIGYNQKFTQDNFNKMATNMRGFYSQAGVKTKADAYQLANQAYAENRISAADLVGMQRTFDMIYNPNGFETAQSMMAGRHVGIDQATNGGASTGVNINGVIREGKDNPVATNTGPQSVNKGFSGPQYVTKGGSSNRTPPGSTFDDSSRRGGALSPGTNAKAPPTNTRDFSAVNGGALGRSKNEVAAANRNKYGQKNAFDIGGAL